jgi:hypothetical protein
MLALKLTLVPAFLLLLALAGARWGPGVAGWLTGLPAVVAPILLFLAIERGAPFAAQAAIAALSAVAASVAFIVAYSRACRHVGWPGAAGGALLAWAAVAAVLAQLPASVPVALAVAAAGLALAPRLLPPARAAATGRRTSGVELALRMAAGALLTVAVTATAAGLGTAWSGVLTAFPVLSLVMAVFSHRSEGPGFVVALQRATIGGLLSYVAFCATLAVALQWTQRIGVSFGIALAATVAAQWLSRRSARPSPAPAGPH